MDYELNHAYWANNNLRKPIRLERILINWAAGLWSDYYVFMLQ